MIKEKISALAADRAWRWAVLVFAGMRAAYCVWSLVIFLLAPSLLQNLTLFGAPVVAAFDMRTGERHVYSRVVAGQTLTFRELDDRQITDAETGSVWELTTGRAVGGIHAGAALAQSVYTPEDLYPYRGVAPETGWFGLWQRFDVLWYQAIAQYGYGANAGDIHFPPLYPLLERILGLALGGRFFLAGWLISQVALVASLALLYRITVRWCDTQTARRAVVLLVLFPTAFFFFTAYSESLFLLWSLLAFDALDKGQRARAGLAVMLAILTRLQGIALIVPLAYAALETARATRKVHFRDVVMLALALGGGAFYLLLRALAGEGNIVPLNEPQLNARLVMPWENILYALQLVSSGQFLIADILNLGLTVLSVLILGLGWPQLPRAAALYAAATLLVVSLRYVETQPLNSMTRYVLTLFPLFILLAARSKNRWVERAIVYVSIALNLYLTAQFLQWGWVA
jgi:hypothetical protein